MIPRATGPRTKAERCFALARSTTFPYERDAAIARGIAIAIAAGFDLDGFDIHGRPRTPPRAPPGIRFRSQAAPQGYTSQEFDAAMRAYRANERAAAAWARKATGSSDLADALAAASEALRRRAAEVGAADDETIYAARRRNFDGEAALARARDASRGR